MFVDDNLDPYPDQWRLLASIRRVREDEAEWVVSDAARHGQIIGVRASITEDYDHEQPWNLPPSRKKAQPLLADGTCPKSIELVKGNLIYVPKAGIPEPLLNSIYPTCGLPESGILQGPSHAPFDLE